MSVFASRRCVRLLVNAATVLAACVAAPAHAQTDQLYGVRGTSLIRLDPDNPALVTTIGSTGFVADMDVYALAYHPGEQAFFGIGQTSIGGFAQSLVRINPVTGAGTIVTNFGFISAVGVFEGLEYVDALNSLVVVRSAPNNFSATQLNLLSPTGGLTSLVTLSPADNDTGVYDSRRNLYFTMDGNNVGQLQRFNLPNGAATALGAIPLDTGDAAYSSSRDAIYITNGANINRIVTTNGNSPITITNTGAVSGGAPRGVAFLATSAAPEPSAFALLGSVGGIACFARRVTRRGRKRAAS
jgi:hypothetical protein